MHSVLVRKHAFTYNHRLYIKEAARKEMQKRFANI